MFAGNGLDPINGRSLAFIMQSGGALATARDYFLIQIITLKGEMSAGAGGHSATYFTAIQKDDRYAFEREFIGERGPAYSRANDRDLRFSGTIQARRAVRRDVHPQ
jgi:hypothetical protein